MADWSGHNGPEIEEPEWLRNPGNWIAISRSLEEHPVVGYGQPVKPATESRGSYSRAEAWQSLLNMAARRPTKVHTWGLVVTLSVGELLGARGYLAQKWNWSDKTVRVFLETLQREGMIEVLDRNFEKIRGQERGQEEGQENSQGNRRRPNVISVRNYSRYQLLTDEICRYIEGLRGPKEGPREGPTRGQEDHEIGAERGAERGAKKITPEGPLKDVVNQGVTHAKGQQLDWLGAERGAERGAKNGDSQGPESNLPTSSDSPRTDSTPLPPASQGASAAKADAEAARSSRQVRRRSEAREFIDLYNQHAEQGGWAICRTPTPAIEQRLVKRVGDIGGRERFEVALKAVTLNDFLSGRIPGRDGAPPFKLDIQRLLQTDGRMGDVLAGLIDRAAAAEAAAKPKYQHWWENPERLAEMDHEKWLRLYARWSGEKLWPIDKLGPPPDAPGCVWPEDVIAELNLRAIWNEHGIRRQRSSAAH